jgi:sigma-B regulation protein RsbU (phosphoserine phosphatase)
VGGDYYDYILKDDGVYFSIGDVTGHGLSSGVVMLMAQSSFTMALRSRDHDLPVIMEKMNKVLYSNIRYRMKEETNMTMAVVRYHEGKLDICGQHEHVLIARNDGTMETINTLDLGIYIGLDDDINHLFHVMNTRMDAGDTVLLYTDGATEAENDKHEEFGLERLKESFARHSKKNLQAVLESIRGEVYDWIGKSEVYDDITLLLFRRR